MSHDVKALFLLELRGLYGFNVWRHTKDAKARRRAGRLAVVWAFLVVMIAVYMALLTVGLVTVDMAAVVPPYLTMVATLFVFFFGLMRGSGALFSPKGYDELSTLPLHPAALPCSRVAVMLLEDIGITALVMLPGMVAYGVLLHPGWWFYVAMLAGVLCVPLLPLAVATLCGTLVALVAARMRYKAAMQTALSLVLVVGVLVGSFSVEQLETLTPEALADLANTLYGVIGRVYPPALWLGEAVFTQPLYLLLFAGVSAAVTGPILWGITRCFHGLVCRLSAVQARHNYRLGVQKRGSLTAALYRREAKRYFSSAIYVTNTIIGPIMGLILSVALAVVGGEQVTAGWPLPVDFVDVLPFALAAVFTMMTTTACSISMEGGQLWIVKSLPVPVKAWLNSKILLNLSLVAPFYLVSEAMVLAVLRPTWQQALALLAVPAAVIVFSVVFGITVNLKLPRFDWEQEAAVVKQGASVAIGGFAGPLVSLVCVGAVLGLSVMWLWAVVCILLAMLTVVLYRYNNKFDMKDLI